MCRLKRLFLILAVGLYAGLLHAQTSEFIKDHIIVAFDKAGCDLLLMNDDSRKAVVRYLFEAGAVEKDKTLFTEGDMISVLGFCTDPTRNSMSGYSYGVKIPGEPSKSFLHQRMTMETARYRFSPAQWKSLVSYSNPNIGKSDKKYSLVSVARPYCLRSLRIKADQYNEKHLTNRTFIIMVTDHRYNGNSFYDEVLYIAESQAKRNASYTDIMFDRIFKVCHEVESEYYIKYISSTPISGLKSGFVEIYEYIPHQSYLSLSSIVDYPHSVEAVRLKGDSCSVDVSFNKRDNDHYRIKKLDLLLKYKGGRDTLLTYTDTDSITFNQVFHRNSCPEHLEARVWLRLMDGVYNSTILTPSRGAPKYLGGEALNVSVPVNMEPDAEVLGIPMPDWMWIGTDKDQYKAAMLMEFLIIAGIIVLLVVLVVILYFIFRYYRPKKEEITIRYYY